MLMRKYENLFIIDPELPDEAVASVEEKIKNVVSGNGGLMIKWDSWGKKKLAYPIKKRTRGNYVLIEFAAGAGLVAELERNMRFDERILKFLTVKLEDRFETDTLLEPEASAEVEPEAEATETAAEASEEMSEGTEAAEPEATEEATAEEPKE